MTALGLHRDRAVTALWMQQVHTKPELVKAVVAAKILTRKKALRMSVRALQELLATHMAQAEERAPTQPKRTRKENAAVTSDDDEVTYSFREHVHCDCNGTAL